jgi:hypothetical protein
MSERISLREAEQKVFQSTFQDGLWDIMLGCVVLMFAVGPFLTPSMGDFWGSVAFVPFWALAFLGVWLVRKYVVRPRVGVVKFGSWRKTRLLRFNVATAVVCLAALALGILSAVNFDVPGWVHVARFSLAILVGFSLAAYMLGFTWLYVYGVLIALSPLVGEWLYVGLGVPHHGYPVTFGITTGAMLLVGLIKLYRLVRDHPLRAEEALHERVYDG